MSEAPETLVCRMTPEERDAIVNVMGLAVFDRLPARMAKEMAEEYEYLRRLVASARPAPPEIQHHGGNWFSVAGEKVQGLDNARALQREHGQEGEVAG